MEAVVDSLRRIISRWTKTATPLLSDIAAGDDTLHVRTSKRFRKNDEVMLRGPTQYEKHRLRVQEVLDNNHIQLSEPLLFPWRVDDGAVLVKSFNGMFVQGVYVGDPENIPRFPAITINGISQDSEWMTIDSVKDTFNVEIGIFVEDSTQEAGQRFLWRLTKLVRASLSNNLFPLVNDYDTTTVTADINLGDYFVKVADSGIFCVGDVMLIEDQYKTIENRIEEIVDETTIKLQHGMVGAFDAADDPAAIHIRRFIFNSYPKSVNFGKITKGTLLKAGVIEWFGWEEVQNPTEGGGWSDTQLR
jgi:hypothetical protein